MTGTAIEPESECRKNDNPEVISVVKNGKYSYIAQYIHGFVINVTVPMSGGDMTVVLQELSAEFMGKTFSYHQLERHFCECSSDLCQMIFEVLVEEGVIESGIRGGMYFNLTSKYID